jgi:hypothetical protein
MIGISGGILIWISHFLFIVSRNIPKIDLRRLMMRNEYAEARGMVVSYNRVSFTGDRYRSTVFIDYEMKEKTSK